MIGISFALANVPVVALSPEVMPTYWFVLPLVLAMSAVYSASRSESWPRIIGSTIRWFSLIVAVLALAVVVLLVINTQV